MLIHVLSAYFNNEIFQLQNGAKFIEECRSANHTQDFFIVRTTSDKKKSNGFLLCIQNPDVKIDGIGVKEEDALHEWLARKVMIVYCRFIYIICMFNI